jgi:hypothetical protein
LHRILWIVGATMVWIGRVLALAKNGDQLSWEEKFHAANGKAQACTQGAFLFALVPNVFSLCSLQVRNGFLSGSQYVPQVLNVFPNMFSIARHFYPLCFGKCCRPFTYIGGPKGRNSTLHNRRFYLVKLP